MLMDVDADIDWTELVTMAQDRDDWKLTVRKMKLAAKSRVWKEATAEKKAT